MKNEKEAAVLRRKLERIRHRQQELDTISEGPGDDQVVPHATTESV